MSIEIDIILTMKLLAMIPLLPMAAFAVTVEPLPQSEFADTEVSTNIAFAVERPAMTRIEFTVALDATPTNNVEVAIGTDANSDGNLSVEESAYVFGYDCGKWFERVRDQGLGIRDQVAVPAPVAETATVRMRVEKTFVLKRRQMDTAWNLVKVTRRGWGSTCELVEAKGRKPGFKLEVR